MVVTIVNKKNIYYLLYILWYLTSFKYETQVKRSCSLKTFLIKLSFVHQKIRKQFLKQSKALIFSFIYCCGQNVWQILVTLSNEEMREDPTICVTVHNISRPHSTRSYQPNLPTDCGFPMIFMDQDHTSNSRGLSTFYCGQNLF